MMHKDSGGHDEAETSGQQRQLEDHRPCGVLPGQAPNVGSSSAAELQTCPTLGMGCLGKHWCNTAAEALTTRLGWAGASPNPLRISHAANASQLPTESSACKTLRPGQQQQQQHHQEDLRLAGAACRPPALPVLGPGYGLDGSVLEPATLHPRPWKQFQHSSLHRAKLLKALPQLARPVTGARGAAGGQQPSEPGRPRALGSSRALRAVAQAHKQRPDLASGAKQSFKAAAAAAVGAAASTDSSEEEQHAERTPAQLSAWTPATDLPLPCGATLPASQQRTVKGTSNGVGATRHCSLGVDDCLVDGHSAAHGACEGIGLGMSPQEPDSRACLGPHSNGRQDSPQCRSARLQKRQQQQRQVRGEQPCAHSGRRHKCARQSGLPGFQQEQMLQINVSTSLILTMADRRQQPAVTDLLAPSHPAQGAAPGVPGCPPAFLVPCELLASAALQPKAILGVDCAPPGPLMQSCATAGACPGAVPLLAPMPVPARQVADPATWPTGLRSHVAAALSAAAGREPAEVPTGLAVKEQPASLPEGRQLRKRKSRQGTEEPSGQVPEAKRRMAAATGCRDQHHQQGLAPTVPPWAAHGKQVAANVTALVQAAAARQPLHPWQAGWLPGAPTGRLGCTIDGSSSSSSRHDGSTNDIRPTRPLPGWLAYQEAAFSPAFHACDSPESLQALVAATSAAFQARQPGLNPASGHHQQQERSRNLEGEQDPTKTAAARVGAGQPGAAKCEPRLALPEAFARLLAYALPDVSRGPSQESLPYPVRLARVMALPTRVIKQRLRAALLSKGAELEALAPSLASARAARRGLVPSGLPPRPRKAPETRAK